MEATQTHSKLNTRVERIIGAILLLPPVLGVLLFVLHLFFSGSYEIPRTSQLGDELMGRFYSGQHTHAAPIYLGLMAIAGAILFKGNESKK